MKAWMGFGRTLYVFDPAVLADVLLRVWEHDPNAVEGSLFGGKPTVTLSHGLSVETRAAINNEVYTVNGIQRPTAAEIEADAHRKPNTPLNSPSPSMERGQGGEVPRRIPPPVRGLTDTHIEPDGAAGYAHTTESRYGVPVGADWRKPLPLVTLYHSAMLAA